tara:strand:+ start:127 stop:285 length:159 start_codon:yes stop_codon:yes gene_type:complete
MKAFFGVKTSANMFDYFKIVTAFFLICLFKVFYGKAEYRFKIIRSFTLQISI